MLETFDQIRDKKNEINEILTELRQKVAVEKVEQDQHIENSSSSVTFGFIFSFLTIMI